MSFLWPWLRSILVRLFDGPAANNQRVWVSIPPVSQGMEPFTRSMSLTLAVTAALLLCIVAPKAGGQSAAIRPAIVLVHGRDQPVGKRADVERGWRSAVAEGITRSRLKTSIRADDVHFVWYADILAGSQACDFGTGLGEVVNRAPGYELWDKVRDTLVAAARQLPNGTQRRILQLRMQDVGRYLGNGSLACGVDNSFKATVTAAGRDRFGKTRPVIIVAHSLGSMITYKNLRNALSDFTSPIYLITVGAMIGDAGVQHALLGAVSDYPAPVPLPVTWWRNIINDGDFLAFKTEGAFFSSNAAKRPTDEWIRLGNVDRHSATDYLGSPLFGQRIVEAWCRASDAPATCGK